MDGPQLSQTMLTKLRASVLGANDGIVSTASVVMGVAGAGAKTSLIFTAGLAALIAGALSMATGEYVSVSSQRDAEKEHIKKTLKRSAETHEVTNPIHAAVASLVAFSAGGLIPLLAVMVAPGPWAIWAVTGAVLAALLLAGYASATVGGASRKRAMIRVTVGGMLAMALTYCAGLVLGTQIQL